MDYEIEDIEQLAADDIAASAEANTARGDEFDAFARALADALRTRYRNQDKARAFARKAAGELGRLTITEVVIRDRSVSVGLRSSVVKIEIIGEVRPF